MLLQASDDEIIDMLNNGNIFFTSLSQSNQLTPPEELYIRMTLRIGNQDITRDLYLKGQLVSVSANRGQESQTTSHIKVNQQIEREETKPSHHCVTCNRSFRSYNLFLRHTYSCHGDQGVYKCISCDESFLYCVSFKNHMRKKHKDKILGDYEAYTSFTANDKDIKQKGQNVEDIQTPRNELSANESLDEHSEVLVNSAEKLPHGSIQLDETSIHIKFALHQCSYCNKEFNYLPLIHHLKSHHGDGLIPCNRCDKRFDHITPYQKHRLNDHNLYEGNKYFQCGICDKTFSRMKKCRDHLKGFHNIILTNNKHTRSRETTPQCNQSLENQDQNNHPLSGHSKIQHPEKLKSIDSIDPGNLCEPKIEVTEDEDIWFTEVIANMESA